MFIGIALALAALAVPAVHASGTAAVVNMCKFPVYVWSVSNEQSPMIALPNSTIGYQELYRSKPDGSGVSIKLAPTFINGGDINMSENITQFEYTLTSGTNQVWYDISNVNGNGFQGSPVVLQPSDLSCPNVTCAQDDSICKGAYNNPNDDLATHVCDSSADLFFLLCPANNDGATSSTGSSSSTGKSDEVANVVVGANGVEELSSGPLPNQSSNQAPAAPDLSSLTGLDALNGTVSKWVTYSTPTKRDEEVSARHSHREFHERARRSRVFRHSHD